MQTFCFEMRRNGYWVYIGKAETTLEQVREAFPYAEIIGNGVLIYGPPR